MPAKALIAEAGSESPASIRIAHVAAICSTWQKLKPGTRIGYHVGLRYWLGYLGCPIQCLAGIPHVTSPDSPTRTVSDTEFERVYRRASPGLRLMLLLTRDASLRAATAYRLSASEIDGDTIRTKTKWDGSIVVPFAGRLAEHIRAAVAIAEPGQSLVCALGVGGKSTGGTLRKRLQHAQKAEGVSKWTWHDLRRTTAQRLYKASGDLRKVQALLGHKSMLASLHYLNAARETVSLADLDLYGSVPSPPSPSAPPNPQPTGEAPPSGSTLLSVPQKKPAPM